MISSLGKRVFLLRNVHEKHPVLFQTRWAMNYLAGPITRLKIPALNALAGVAPEAAPEATTAVAIPSTVATSEPEPEIQLPGHETRPVVPRGIEEYFLPNNLTLSEAERVDGRSLAPEAEQYGILYRPVLFAQAEVQFTNRKYNLDEEIAVGVLVEEPDKRGNIHWEEFVGNKVDPRGLDRSPAANARFTALEAPLSDSRTLRSIKSDFADWIYREIEVIVRANENLDVYAGPDIAEEKFRDMCVDAAEDKQEVEVDKLEASYERKINALKKKLEREERELREDEAELSRRKQNEMTSYAETVFSLFSKRKRSISTAMNKRGMSARAKEDVEESKEEIATLQRELEDLQEELEERLEEIEAKWTEVAADTIEIGVSPYKKDINIDLFGVAWLPYHLILEGDRFQELVGCAFESN